MLTPLLVCGCLFRDLQNYPGGQQSYVPERLVRGVPNFDSPPSHLSVSLTLGEERAAKSGPELLCFFVPPPDNSCDKGCAR